MNGMYCYVNRALMGGTPTPKFIKSLRNEKKQSCVKKKNSDRKGHLGRIKDISLKKKNIERNEYQLNLLINDQRLCGSG